MQAINMIVHYPDSDEKRLELGKKIATIHAQAIIDRLNRMELSSETKNRIIDTILDTYPRKSKR